MSEPSREPLTRDEVLGYLAALEEETVPTRVHEEESARLDEIALPGAAWIGDRSITAFSRGELRVLARSGWFTFFRLYGPLEPWFDKTWQTGDLELVTSYEKGYSRLPRGRRE